VAHLGLAHPDTDLPVVEATTNGTAWSPKPEGGTPGCLTGLQTNRGHARQLKEQLETWILGFQKDISDLLTKWGTPHTKIQTTISVAALVAQ
jgi:hypothetical protein